MNPKEIIIQRLYNQQIADTNCKKPEEIVSTLVAMQSQVWDMGKWAIGLRLPGSANEDIENAYNRGDILRTHVMRPTWHFVTPADIRWLLKLTSPRVHAFNAPYYRKMELDATVFKKANAVFVKMLQGGRQLNRLILKDALEKSKSLARHHLTMGLKGIDFIGDSPARRALDTVAEYVIGRNS